MTEAFSDSMALIGRHLRHLKRVPERLISITITPVAMVIVFGYLFGSSMRLPDEGNYTEYIMAGIFAQVMLSVFGTTALGVSTDLHNGLVDRFRSLPISHTAVLIGRTVSDLMLVAISCVVMAVVGYLIGWRASGGVLATLNGFLLMLLLGLVMSWLGAWVGLALRNPEAVNAVTLFITMPLAFLSASFFPLSNLPSWLRVIAEWNPVSAITSGARELWQNPSAVGPDAAAAVRHPLPFALVTLFVVLLVVVPMATRAFRRAVAR
jgi:ABC-2 type transport system permease protein